MRNAWKLAVVLVALGTIPAQANTYLFTITASDLLLGESGNNDGLANAYSQSGGAAGTWFNESAFYSVFLQPSVAQIGTYSFVSPAYNPSAPPAAWTGSDYDASILDPSSPVLGSGGGTGGVINTYADTSSPCTVSADCSWEYYYFTTPGQTSVTVFSDANNNGNGNIFVDHTYHSSSTAPYGWGTSTLTISAADSATCTTTSGSYPSCLTSNPPMTLAFEITTSQTLSAPVELIGYAEDYESTSTSSLPAFGPKTYNETFTLEVTPTLVTPEPGSGAFLLIGIGLLLVARLGLRRPNRAHADSHR